MSGRGVKRKRSYSVEVEEEIAVRGAGKDEVGVPSEGRSGDPDLNHLQQRQLVLRLGLDKLQRHHQTGTEHRLHRSVLLVNTLRQIQEDMQRDASGSVQLLSTYPGAPLNTLDLSDAPSGLPLDGAPLCSFPKREEVPPTCPGCADTDQLGVSSSHPSLPTWSETPSRESMSGCFRLPLHPVDTANSLGYLTDFALDDIFEDIDTSMYESSEPPSAWTAYSSWAMGVISWGDEELKMFSSYASASTLPSCLTDVNDLDHILEILVNC